MGEIYKNSRETIIWLGEQQEDDDVGERFADISMSPEDKSMANLGGPSRITFQGDSRDRKLRTNYMWDYEYSELMARHEPHSPNPEMYNPRNDIFGAFCLVHNLAHGTSSLAIDFLGIDVTRPIMYSQAEYNVISDRGGHKNPAIREYRSERVRSGLQKLMSKPWVSRPTLF
jgi:hypothetical protein